ncbi:MAG: hypothetical protein J6P40_07285 [Oscillospiraceae bacterium]|nr:hypothetical protein [Oscillospiraceae bacterium]
MKRIIDKVPLTELLAGLAEESCELAQAALKMRRALDGTNPTPVSVNKALDALQEEIADVLLYAESLQPVWKTIMDTMIEKKERWAKRLEEVKVE